LKTTGSRQAHQLSLEFKSKVEEKMFVITGASGHIGSVIAENLLKNGKKVRAIARNREHLKNLEKLGAESFPGNVQDASFLSKAFQGATAVFTMNPPNPVAEDAKKYQRSVTDAIVSALSSAKVPSIVNLSSVGGEVPEGTGPIAGLHYQEEQLNHLKDANILHLRPTYFMENFLMDIPMIKKMGIDGSPVRADFTIGMIATRDIGNYAAGRLNELDFKGKSVKYLLGPRDYQMAEAASILGHSIGKPDLAYVQFPYEDALQAMVQSGLSQSVAEIYVEMARGMNEGLIVQERRNSQNTTPTTLEEFAKQVFAPAYQTT
jgi:uncharacterized protein YbjT (DUF2867 family)